MAVLSCLCRAAQIAALGALVACTDAAAPQGPPPDMGDFRLGHFAVGAENAQAATGSRNATPEQWTGALDREIRARLAPADGNRFYHLSIRVDGYFLAPPGIPVLFSPRSFLVITANVWDDSAGAKLNPAPEQIIVLEGVSGKTVIGSGLTQTAQGQIDKLSRNAAKQVQDWLLRHPEWFGIGDADMPETTSAS